MAYSSIDKYRIIKELGRGGMGCVYLGYDDEVKRDVAIKVLHPQYAVVPEHVERLKTEAQAANIINHPGVVKYDKIGQLEDKTMYLVMEYIIGETLADRMKSRPIPWNEYESIPIITQLSSILAAAHQKSIIHRDIKPSNIMLVSDEEAIDGERVKLLDFGIAKLAAGIEATGKRTTKTGQLLGSPRYMAPEQCRGVKSIDGKADVYALGILLYEIFVGEPPFIGPPADVIAWHLFKPIRPLHEVAPQLSHTMAKAIQAMLEKEPAVRPDIGELLAIFRAIRRDLRGSLSSISLLAPLARAAEALDAQKPSLGADVVSRESAEGDTPAPSRKTGEETPADAASEPLSAPRRLAEPETVPNAPLLKALAASNVQPSQDVEHESTPTAPPQDQSHQAKAAPAAPQPSDGITDLRNRPTQPMQRIDLTAAEPPSAVGTVRATERSQGTPHAAMLWGGALLLALCGAGTWGWMALHSERPVRRAGTSSPISMLGGDLAPAVAEMPSRDSPSPADLASPGTSQAIATTATTALPATGQSPSPVSTRLRPLENSAAPTVLVSCETQESALRVDKQKILHKGIDPKDNKLADLVSRWRELHEVCPDSFYYVEEGRVQLERCDYQSALKLFNLYEQVPGKNSKERLNALLVNKKNTCTEFMQSTINTFLKLKTRCLIDPLTPEAIRAGWDYCGDIGFLVMQAELYCAEHDDQMAQTTIRYAKSQEGEPAVMKFLISKLGGPSTCALKELQPDLRNPFPKGAAP